MAGQLFAQGGNLFLGYRTGVVPPLTSLKGQDIRHFLVAETFPRLHHGGSELFTLYLDRTLQSFHHDHRGSARTTGGKLRSSQRRIALAFRTEPVGLMANRAVRQKNL